MNTARFVVQICGKGISMGKIQLIIELDEKDYEELNTFYILNLGTEEYRKIIEKHCTDAIRHGKPLPIGHGRLIDADKLDTRERGNNSQRTMWLNINHIIKEAPTIIDAEE